MQYNREQIENAVKAKGYRWFDKGSYNLNIVGIRNSDTYDEVTNKFDDLMTVWMGFKPIWYKTSGSKYIRGEQVNEVATHEFTARVLEFSTLGKEFGLGFSVDFKGMADLSPWKSDYFLFVQKDTSVRGRLFRILEAQNNNEEDE